MEYLERNEAIIKEVRENAEVLTFDHRHLLASSTTTQVFSIGNFFSEILGRELYLAEMNFDGNGVRSRLSRDLSIAEMIARDLPNHADNLWAFRGLLVNSAGKDSIITEDLSAGGTHNLLPVNLEELPSDLLDYLDRHFDPSFPDRGRICYKTNGVTKIVDLCPSVSEEEGFIQRHLDIRRGIEIYTLNLDENSAQEVKS